MFLKLGLGFGNRGNGTLVTLPAGFTKWSPTFSITENGRSYTTDFDPETLKPTGTTKWVATNGNDTNDGSQGSPYATIAKAVTEGANVINVSSGIYDRSNSWASNFEPSIDTAVVAIDGPGTVILTRAATGLSWTAESSPNDDVYATTRSAVGDVIDMTAAGRSGEYLKDGVTEVPIPYTLVASIAACQALPGSWYQSGSDLYVHTHDSREPDSDVLVNIAENQTRIRTDITLYLDGLEIWGDQAVNVNLAGANNAILVAVDTAARFCNDADCFDLDDNEYAYLIRCTATDSTAGDGFNYHNADATAPSMRILEVDCEARRNGVAASSNDNGSSAHDDTAIIRLNGTYELCYGPSVADVGGTQSLNYGVSANNSLSTPDEGTSDAGFLCSTAGDADTMMWLRNCSATGSFYDRSQGTGGVITDLGGFIGDGNDNGTIS